MNVRSDPICRPSMLEHSRTRQNASGLNQLPENGSLWDPVFSQSEIASEPRDFSSPSGGAECSIGPNSPGERIDKVALIGSHSGRVCHVAQPISDWKKSRKSLTEGNGSKNSSTS